MSTTAGEPVSREGAAPTEIVGPSAASARCPASQRMTPAASAGGTRRARNLIIVTPFQRARSGGSSPRTTEEQDIAVGVLELETAQTVVSVLQRLGKLDIARSKFSRQGIRIRDVKVCVPAGPRLSPVVRQWIYANILEHDTRTASANDAEEDVVSGPLEGDLKSKPVPVKRKR